MEKFKELEAVKALWNTLDDGSIIRDVLFKGKFIQNAIVFISERNSIEIEEGKDIFLQVLDNIVLLLVKNKQTYRAVHVLKNAQINELHYFYNLYEQETSSTEVKSILYEYLCNNSENFKDNEIILKGYYMCFKLLEVNIEKHAKYLDNINRIFNNSAITIPSIKKTSFAKFMKQPIQWRNVIAIDVFFKSKRDPRNLYLLPILDKNYFFTYIIQAELTALLKKWLNEQYLCKAGKTIPSTISEPQTFDEAINFLFRRWNIDENMMNQISRRQKDVIKNEFAKLGFFEIRESKLICRKLNRFFSTHTFQENYHTLKSCEITKFVLDNKLIELLPNKFIDHQYIDNVLKESENKHPLHEEIMLLKSLRNLLSEDTDLNSFVEKMNSTTNYIQKHDKTFNINKNELRFMNAILNEKIDDFHKIADMNSFTRDFYIKLNTIEDLSTISQLLESFHSINLDYIRDEFKNNNYDFIPNFEDQNLSNLYGEEVHLNYLDYIMRGQGTYASYVFIIDAIRNSMSLSRPIIISGCEGVAKLAINDCENERILSHVIAFLETFSVDTRNLRCFLHLLKLKLKFGKDEKNFEKFLDATIRISSKAEDIRNVESLEVFWKVKKYTNPERSYLNTYFENNDWFRLVLMAQHFNYSLDAFIKICQERLKNKTLCDNLIRAVSYDAAPEQKRRLSFSKRLRSKSCTSETQELFSKGEFLDSKDDLFSILLKCNELVSRLELPFDDFQKFFLKSVECDDLLYQAKKYDWPLLAVLAATTKLYRFKYCWITWLILSSNYKFSNKFENIEDLTTSIFEHCIRIGYLRTLDESLEIFYPKTAIKIFTTLLRDTADGKFINMEMSLKTLIVKLNETDFQTNILKGKKHLIPFIIHCLIIHLHHNIKFSAQQQEYLTHVHKSEIVKFYNKFNFELLNNFCKILERTNVEMNYETFYECEKNAMKEIDRICDELISNNQFEAAIEIANLMNKSKTDFVFKFWMHMRMTDNQKQTSFDISKYMRYVDIYGINMEVFIKFLNSVVEEMDQCIEKYKTMIFIFRYCSKNNVNDQLEYDIIHLYISLKIKGVEDIDPLTSNYYENIIKNDKSLIHDSLYELKAIAMIDDLKVSNKTLKNDDEIKELDELMFYLLDINDIVEVLRIQEMFGYAPEDLKILVYMLSVSEGITSIYDITKQERLAISSYGQLSKRFNRFALRALRTSSSNSMSLESSMLSMDLNESSIIDEPSSYQENKETLQALQGLLYKLKHGIKYGQRIVLLYRISLFLNTHTFSDLMKIKRSAEFMEMIATADCENKLLAMSDTIQAMEMTREEVTRYISKEITVSIIKTRFQQFSKDTESSNAILNMTMSSSSSSWSPSKLAFDDIWGLSLSKDLHLILELCKGMTTLLGSYLIKFYKFLSQESPDIPFKCDAFDEDFKSICDELNRSLAPQVMSRKKQNIIRVEMLITAHECFGQDTEGIGEILYLSKRFVNELAETKNFNLIVKLLCGLGRYREMFYCFDILIKNEAFESLLGQFNDKQTNGLKNALLSYLKEYHPINIEYFKMCASHFLMYTELAKIWKSSAMRKIQKLINESQVKILKIGRILASEEQLEVPYLKCTKNALSILNDSILDMIHATEMMTTDNKIEMSLKYSALCELIAMQMHLVKIGIENETKICPCVVYQEQNSEKSQLIAQYLANYELSVPQMMILSKNLTIPIEYTKTIFCRTIIVGDDQYLHEFVGHLELTDSMIENIIKLTQSEAISKKQEKFLHELCLMIHDVGLKFRLASLLGLKPLLQQLLNDEQSYCYLLDSKYGNFDIYQ